MYMQPKFWGPLAWHTLHSVAYYYEGAATKPNSLKHFYKSLTVVLPCYQCREHYTDWMNSHESDLVDAIDKNRLAELIVDLHNHVNSITQDPPLVMSQQDARKLYFVDGTLHICHAKIFKFIDIVVNEAAEEHMETNIHKFQQYIVFFNALREVFPCPVCRSVLQNLMIEHSITDVTDAQSLITWYKSNQYKFKKAHIYLDVPVYVMFSQDDKWYRAKVNMHGAKYIEKRGNDIYVIMDNSKEIKVKLPTHKSVGIATEVDIDIINKIPEQQTPQV